MPRLDIYKFGGGYLKYTFRSFWSGPDMESTTGWTLRELNANRTVHTADFSCKQQSLYCFCCDSGQFLEYLFLICIFRATDSRFLHYLGSRLLPYSNNTLSIEYNIVEQIYLTNTT